MHIFKKQLGSSLLSSLIPDLLHLGMYIDYLISKYLLAFQRHYFQIMEERGKTSILRAFYMVKNLQAKNSENINAILKYSFHAQFIQYHTTCKIEISGHTIIIFAVFTFSIFICPCPCFIMYFIRY
jgi:hypothetical protein